jgi:hypothetical protein
MKKSTLPLRPDLNSVEAQILEGMLWKASQTFLLCLVYLTPVIDLPDRARMQKAAYQKGV